MTEYSDSPRRREQGVPPFALKNPLLLPARRVMGFIGANGAGKSTTIRILMGLVYPRRGTVRLMGEPVPERQARRPSATSGSRPRTCGSTARRPWSSGT